MTELHITQYLQNNNQESQEHINCYSCYNTCNVCNSCNLCDTCNTCNSCNSCQSGHEPPENENDEVLIYGNLDECRNCLTDNAYMQIVRCSNTCLS